jgi:hypothetical protein
VWVCVCVQLRPNVQMIYIYMVMYVFSTYSCVCVCVQLRPCVHMMICLYLVLALILN